MTIAETVSKNHNARWAQEFLASAVTQDIRAKNAQALGYGALARSCINDSNYFFAEALRCERAAIIGK